MACQGMTRHATACLGRKEGRTEGRTDGRKENRKEEKPEVKNESRKGGREAGGKEGKPEGRTGSRKADGKPEGRTGSRKGDCAQAPHSHLELCRLTCAMRPSHAQSCDLQCWQPGRHTFHKIWMLTCTCSCVCCMQVELLLRSLVHINV